MEDWRHLQDIQGSYSSHLDGKLVGICVTGSIACIEIHRLARVLIRHGARVQFFLTEAAQKMVSAQSLGWCTGRQPVCALTSRCEHLEYFGKNGKADLLLLAPATANTIGKVAHGLDDNVVTTCVTTALGGEIPVLCAPGMHEPMLGNPAVVANLKTLAKYGVDVLHSNLSEGKAKMMSVEEMAVRVLRRLGPGDLTQKRVLITGGPTREFIDPARCLTNPSSGLTACLLASEAYRRGGEVTLVYGPGKAIPPSFVDTISVVSCQDMLEAVEDALNKQGFDLAVACAAVSDYRPSRRSSQKRPTSEGGFELALSPTPKVLDRIRELAPGATLVSFKAASTRDDGELQRAMTPYLKQGRADFVVGNSISTPGQGFDSTTNRYLTLHSKDPKVRVLGPGPKGELVPLLWEQISSFISL